MIYTYPNSTRTLALICCCLLGFSTRCFGQTNEKRPAPASTRQKPAQQKPLPTAAEDPNSSKADQVKLHKLAVAPFTIGPGVQWTAASLDNKLAAAAKNGSLYFRKIPSNALMESRAQLQELNSIKDEAAEPDFLLLNCTVEKVDAQKFEISATLVSADRSNEIAVITAFAESSSNTAAELTAELWRKLDHPIEILRDRPNLMGDWIDTSLQQGVTVVSDEGVQLVAHPSKYWTEVEGREKKLAEVGINESYRMWTIFDGQWRRGMLEGRFSGSNGYFSPLIVATVLEDRHERRLHLSFPDGKSLVWRYMPPEMDTGYWKAPDGRTFKFVLGVDRISGKSDDPVKSPEHWNRIEAFLRGQDLFVTYLNGDRILARTTGKLDWSRDPAKASKMVIDNQEWKFSPLTY